MTNTGASDAEIVARIKGAGWWQGSVAEDSALRRLEPSLPDGFDCWVVASQTCNLYNPSLEKISKVEWIGARFAASSSAQLKGGRNPRALEAIAASSRGDVLLVCDSHERHWARRASLAEIAPEMALKNLPGQGQGKRLLSAVLSRQMESGMMFATPLGSGVQPASLAAQFQGRKSSTRFTG